ncbi:hypothetical protein PF005_g4916 [Phytophthora fragariae]|nr:hypothetical protein PF003_g39631 [Phytophthora fragariae]KAE8947964.1 hypothetical protein PF009_g2441 [Phytophthora fragariae]KAE9028452.1 hypothetical protein PF011_g1552 [Phytophthora fragariae]KAE9136099.1 hypothetical protein PF007_g2296 [Phytophthora fragariae]KAE9136142.1 hypothetical protein PF010_g1790 [Phytophthora fragariae]
MKMAPTISIRTRWLCAILGSPVVATMNLILATRVSGSLLKSLAMTVMKMPTPALRQLR